MAKLVYFSGYILLLFYCGCNDHESTRNSSEHFSSSPPSPRTADNLAQLIESNLGTSGTLMSDYGEAYAFIEANPNDISFSNLAISPKENLDQGYDTAFALAREYWKKSRRNTASPLMTKFLIFCRLMRNAARTRNEKCRSQLVRDATVAMELTSTRKQHPNDETKFDTLRIICQDLWKNENVCREFPLRNVLAIIIIQVNRTDPESRGKSFRVFEQFLRNFGFLNVEYNRCKTDKERYYYIEFLDDIFKQLRRVLELPPPNMCHNDLINDVLAQIDTIDDKKRPFLQC